MKRMTDFFIQKIGTNETCSDVAGIERLEWLRPLVLCVFCLRLAARHNPSTALHSLASSATGGASAVHPFTLRVPVVRVFLFIRKEKGKESLGLPQNANAVRFVGKRRNDRAYD